MKLLFICTHNRCRSILAEAVTNYYGKGQVLAKSAGSQPAGKVHPRSLKYLQKMGIPTEGLSSQKTIEILIRRIETLLELNIKNENLQNWPDILKTAANP